MCIIPFCIDDEGSSGDEILHPFKPDLFESSHEPNDDESSDDYIYHPFEPDMFESIHNLMMTKVAVTKFSTHSSQDPCMSLMIVMMRKLFMTLKLERSRVVVILIIRLVVVMIIL